MFNPQHQNWYRRLGCSWIDAYLHKSTDKQDYKDQKQTNAM